METTVSYSEMLAQFKRDIGLDENFGENEDLEKSFNGWFNDRLREIWRAAAWTQCMGVNGFPVCSDGVALVTAVVDAGDKFGVYYDDPRFNFSPKEAQSVLGDGFLFVGERIVSKPLAEKVSVSGKDYQLSGKIFTNRRDCVLNPGDVYVLYRWMGMLDYYLKPFLYAGAEPKAMPEKSEISDEDIASGDWIGLGSVPFENRVWLVFKSIPPRFDMDGMDEVSGLQLGIPVFMKRYVQLAVHSDYLRANNRQGEAEAVFARAAAVLDDEVYRFECFTQGDRYGHC